MGPSRAEMELAFQNCGYILNFTEAGGFATHDRPATPQRSRTFCVLATHYEADCPAGG